MEILIPMLPYPSPSCIFITSATAIPFSLMIKEKVMQNNTFIPTFISLC
jgi:hypothetical protein